MKDNALIIARVFSAAVERVWRAWTDPDEAKKWWGPKDFTAPAIAIDFRVGGKALFCMRGKPSPEAPEQDFWSTGTYKEIVPMKRIVTTDSFSDADGTIVSPTKYGMPLDFPKELTVILSFEETPDEKTKMTLQHVGMPEGKIREQTSHGWNQSFDKLEKIL